MSNQLRALDGKGGTHDIHKGILTENIPGKSNQLRALDGKGGTHDIHKGENIPGKNIPGIAISSHLDGKGGTHDIHKGILTENIPGKSNQRRALDGKGGTHDIHKGILTENIPGMSNQLRARWKGRNTDMKRILQGKGSPISSHLDGKQEHMINTKGS
ncbi:unnamed protein product [Mytilus edulis]|uniref:Uncharacterized protein n=1 Tax=Mytilus edulis TaxID=6550 RepID=A0A8S3R0P0_MYTED|nr:unnamed protein product [Mytilus edulis]